MKLRPFTNVAMAVLMGIGFLTLGSAGRSGQAAPTAPKVTWEYTSITMNGDPDAELNEYGRAGWELAAVTETRANILLFVLKRPRTR